MTPNHHAELVELLAALNTGDAVRASAALTRFAAILHGEDAEEAARKRATKEEEYRRKRLEIAAVIMASHKYTEYSHAIIDADDLMSANASAPIPDGAIP